MIRIITIVNVFAVDMNLLVVLHAVLEERSVTRAARRLHVTQSAVSNALARLRARLGDRLLVRSGRGLVPTPRALAIAPRLHAAIGELDVVLGEPAFDPLTTRRSFTFADSEQLSQLPRLAGMFARRLPHATLALVVGDDLAGMLASGQADVALGPLDLRGPGLCRRVLYEEAFARVVRTCHPARRRSSLAAYPHVVVEVTASGDRDVAPVGMRVPTYMAAALAVSDSDYVATIPERLARSLSRPLRLRIVDVAGPPRPVALYWHERTADDAGMRFYRDLVIDAVAGSRAPRGRR